MKKMHVVTAFLFASFFLSVHHFAQTEKSFETVEDNANACEINSALADQLRVEAGNTNEVVKIVFRAGSGETSAMNSRRLRIVSKFLKNNKGWKDAQRFSFIIGKKVKGQGKVEFYLGKRLYWTALAKKGKIPCMDCCGYDFESGRF